MSLERRDAQTPESEGKKPRVSSERQKSVIIYILLLFVVAFLLMGLSLLTHQRSNAEALGQLKDSIGAMKEAQTAQDQVIQLQNELADAREAAASFEDAAETARNQASHAEYTLERTREAMDLFWQLDEAYISGDTVRCGELLAEFNQNQESPIKEYLSEKATERYAEIVAALWEPENG